jgi:peptide/nickel transport system permease protein
LIHYLARRLLFALLLVVLVSSAALLLARLAPGDVTSQLGPFANRAEIASTRERFDLDRSPVSQLALWLSRAVRFDFGESYLYSRPVRELIARAAANTAVLAVAALVLATLIGLPLGILTGSRQGALPAAVRGLSLVCLSVPPLVSSLLLVFVASRTRLFPLGGMTSVDAIDLSWSAWFVDVASHLPLPALALALPIAATFERLQSHEMGEALHQPFVLSAVARGVAPRDVILRHAWRASLRPVCAVYGLAVGVLLSGSFVVEYVTAWPGLGRLMYEGLRARDIYLVTGCAAMGGLFLALGSLIGDMLLAVVDPRVKGEGGRGKGE